MGKRDTGKWDIGRRDIIRCIKTGHLFSENRDILLSGNRTTYPLGIGPLFIWDSGLSTLLERFYPLGIGPLILWESDHLSSGIQDIICETGHGKRDTLSSGIQTIDPLGNILW